MFHLPGSIWAPIFDPQPSVCLHVSILFTCKVVLASSCAQAKHLLNVLEKAVTDGCEVTTTLVTTLATTAAVADSPQHHLARSHLARMHGLTGHGLSGHSLYGLSGHGLSGGYGYGDSLSSCPEVELPSLPLGGSVAVGFVLESRSR